MIQIVASRLPGDKHDWKLLGRGKCKCVLCKYVADLDDSLILFSGCPQSAVVLAEAKR